jgi:hypothetical protein
MFTLTSLFEAVQEAIVEANRSVEQNTYDMLCERYFDKKNDKFIPKTMNMVLPNVDGSGKITNENYNIPIFSLVKPHSLSIDKISMDFEVDLYTKEEEHIIASLPKGMSSSKRTSAKVKVKFKTSEPQEGIMLLNDKVYKSFPQ